MTGSQTRRFVVALVVLMLGLSVLATVLITRGWADDDLQERVEDIERDRRQSMPRLDDVQE